MQALKATQRQLTEGHEILRTGASKGEDALDATIKQLTKTADLLEDEFVKESAALETDSTAAALIDGIPGVSPFVAHLVLHWLAVLRISRRSHGSVMPASMFRLARAARARTMSTHQARKFFSSSSTI